jgi:hypothetical protein
MMDIERKEADHGYLVEFLKHVCDQRI